MSDSVSFRMNFAALLAVLIAACLPWSAAKALADSPRPSPYFEITPKAKSARNWSLDSLRVTSNLLYARHPRAETTYTTLDIYGPSRAHAQKLPVVVYVHGGFWRTGCKEDARWKPQWFVDKGFVFVSVNYRLSVAKASDSSRFAHNVKFPTHSLDVADALGYLHREIGHYGGDSSALFLLGHSAGGQIAAISALHAGFLENAGFPRSSLQGVVLLDPGVLDMPYAYAHATDSVRAIYTNAFGPSPQKNTQASPLNHILPGRGYPPFFLAHVRDYSYRQGRRFAERMHDTGGKATLAFIPGKTHGALDQDLGRTGDPAGLSLAQRITDWMAAQLGDWEAQPNPLSLADRRAESPARHGEGGAPNPKTSF